MQNFEVFGPNGKLCGRMDHNDMHIVNPQGPCETARNSRETRETPCATPAKQPRNSAKQARDSCESDANPRSGTVALRATPVRWATNTCITFVSRLY